MFAARPVSSSFRTPGRVRTRSATCISSIQPSSMRLLPSLCPAYSSSLHSALEVRHPCDSVPFYLSSVPSLVRPIARTSHRLCPLFHLIDVVPAGHLRSPQEVLQSFLIAILLFPKQAVLSPAFASEASDACVRFAFTSPRLLPRLFLSALDPTNFICEARSPEVSRGPSLAACPRSLGRALPSGARR